MSRTSRVIAIAKTPSLKASTRAVESRDAIVRISGVTGPVSLTVAQR
jgi:hypothetical protein